VLLFLKCQSKFSAGCRHAPARLSAIYFSGSSPRRRGPSNGLAANGGMLETSFRAAIASLLRLWFSRVPKAVASSALGPRLRGDERWWDLRGTSGVRPVWGRAVVRPVRALKFSSQLRHTGLASRDSSLRSRAAIPSLHLSLALKRRLARRMLLVPDQHCHVVLLRNPGSAPSRCSHTRRTRSSVMPM
jgi:hypothetical protein